MSNTLAVSFRRVTAAPFHWSSNVRPVAIAQSRALIPARSWTCPDCQHSTLQRAKERKAIAHKRLLSISRRLREAPTRTPFNPKPPESSNEPIITTSADLPSKSDERRWPISRRMASIMDSILARASVAGHHINIYTGTDYSGIEAIKNEINEQEEKVEACHDTINAARSTHRDAHTKQASSQKEIVSLLERKSSWSPEDLERYMSLVRSEHTDEQAVQAAKDSLAAAERDLENSRADLERLERKQYHEEQIWSDTIRRNSTWVTFGLMGLNILLLLTQIAIFEPWRRRRIVKEVQLALDERTIAHLTSMREQIDQAIEPVGNPPESIETIPEIKLIEPQTDEMPLSVASDESITPSTQPRASSGRWEACKEYLQDLFSERIISVKKVDITTTALQGAATGVAAMGLLFVLWRPK